MKKDDQAWHPGDPVIEWGGRAEGGEDQQFAFSDLQKPKKEKPEDGNNRS